jgi:DNA-binding NtrC family response regulator
MSSTVRPSVLVAEDQPLLRWAIGRALSPFGVDVVFAPTYERACELLAASRFAAVIVACPLQERSVIELLRELERAQPDTRLVVLCEGDGSESLQRAVPRATVFQKPFTLSALTAAIAPVLREHALA